MNCRPSYCIVVKCDAQKQTMQSSCCQQHEPHTNGHDRESSEAAVRLHRQYGGNDPTAENQPIGRSLQKNFFKLHRVECNHTKGCRRTARCRMLTTRTNLCTSDNRKSLPTVDMSTQHEHTIQQLYTARQNDQPRPQTDTCTGNGGWMRSLPSLRTAARPNTLRDQPVS